MALHVELPEASPVVEADANQVRQVLYNLLINAIDAQPTGGRIQVSMAIDHDSDPNSPAVVIQVELDITRAV